MLPGSRVATPFGVNTLSAHPATGGAAFSRYFRAISVRCHFVATKFDVAYWHLTDKSVLLVFVRFQTIADIDGV